MALGCLAAAMVRPLSLRLVAPALLPLCLLAGWAAWHLGGRWGFPGRVAAGALVALAALADFGNFRAFRDAGVSDPLPRRILDHSRYLPRRPPAMIPP